MGKGGVTKKEDGEGHRKVNVYQTQVLTKSISKTAC